MSNSDSRQIANDLYTLNIPQLRQAWQVLAKSHLVIYRTRAELVAALLKELDLSEYERPAELVPEVYYTSKQLDVHLRELIHGEILLLQSVVAELIDTSISVATPQHAALAARQILMRLQRESFMAKFAEVANHPVGKG